MEHHALLVGLSGVALEPRTTAGRAQVVRALGGAADPEAFWAVYDDLRPAYEVGDFSDAHWWQEVAFRLGVTVDDRDVAEAIAADVDTLTACRRDVVDELMRLVGEGWIVGAVDNVPAAVATRLRREHAWLRELSAVTLSCDIGVAKPDPAIYRVATDAMGVKPGATVYVDCCTSWVENAEQLGFRAVPFTHLADVRKAVEGDDL